MGSLGLRCAIVLGPSGREKAAGRGCTKGSGKLLRDTSPSVDIQRICVYGGGVGLASLATSVQTLGERKPLVARALKTITERV